MNKNVGNTDQIIRLTVATALFMVGFMGPWGGLIQIALIAVGVVMLVVGLTRICPLYSIFGLSTCPLKGKDD